MIKVLIKKLNPKVKKAIDFAYERIVKFHAAQLKTLKDVKYIDKYKNKMENKPIPIESVGIYVPGNLPSTLLMNSVPAKLAKVKRIILTRPAVEAGEKLGFLPGELNEKVDPYLKPLFDALNDMLDFDTVSRLMDKQIIEIAPLAFMRGRTLNDAFIILDEAQNTTSSQMKCS